MMMMMDGWMDGYDEEDGYEAGYEDDGHDDTPPMWICGVLDADGVEWNKPGAPPQPVITAITDTHPSRCPVLGNTDPDRAQ